MAGATGHGVPNSLVSVLQPFRDAFTAPSWEHVLVLVMGRSSCRAGARLPLRCASWVSARLATSPTITAC